MEGLAQSLLSLSGQAQKLAKRLDAYNRLLADPVNNAFVRARALSDLSGLIQAFVAGTMSDERGTMSGMPRRLEEWLKDESAAVEESRTEFRFEFGRQLVAGLEGSGMAIKGQMPLLRVGLFTLRADFEAGNATVFWGPEVEKLKSALKLAPAELAATLRKWNERLKQKSVEPDRLLRLLHKAYERRVTSDQFPVSSDAGPRVFLLDALSELVFLLQPESFRLNPAQEKFVEYPRVRFSYDLFRLKQAGTFEVGAVKLKLHVANFDATTEKAKALWVPDNEDGDGTHYSYISFGK